MVDIGEKLKSTAARVNELSGGVAGILADAYRSFHNSMASQAAASLAYYALFSMFPLLLLVVSIGGYVLENETVYLLVISITSQALPVSEALIQGNLTQIQDIRGSLGVISILTLLWSASGVFRVLVANINLAWREAKELMVFLMSTLARGMGGCWLGCSAWRWYPPWSPASCSISGFHCWVMSPFTKP
jgi:YihY family inner membrane protein